MDRWIYFIGGGGLYHWRQEFTAPTIAVFNGFDPFFGFFQEAVPANQILTSYSVNKPGVNGGVGVSFGTRWHAKFYAEARYHRIIFGDNHADMLPVTFGAFAGEDSKSLLHGRVISAPIINSRERHRVGKYQVEFDPAVLPVADIIAGEKPKTY